MTETNKVLAEIHAERLRQDERWGQQNHSTYFPGLETVSAQGYAREATRLKSLNDQTVAELNTQGYASDRNCTWDTIFREEVYEALAEEDPQKRRAELVQAAAVAVAMIECIDREAANAAE